MKLRTLLMTVTCLVSVGVAFAADDPIAQRRKIMQENERLESKMSQLLLGKYFPDKAMANLKKLEANLTLFPTLFPAGSETGGDTHASAAIWSDTAAFNTLAAEFVTRVQAAEAAVANGQDALNIAWQPVVETCAACHGAYAPGVIM